MFDLSNLYTVRELFNPFNIVHFQTIDSTQRWLLDFDGPLSYVVCVGDEQTSGRGWKGKADVNCRSFKQTVGVASRVPDVLSEDPDKSVQIQPS